MTKLIYLASPYSHPNEKMRNARFRAITKITANILAEGHMAYSPITFGHTCSEWGELPTDWNFWKNMCESFLIKCDELVVVKMPGWKESVGVTAEIKFAQENNIPVSYLEYNELRYGDLEKEVRDEEELIANMDKWYNEMFPGGFKPRVSIAERYKLKSEDDINFSLEVIPVDKFNIGQIVEVEPYRAAPCSGGPDLIVGENKDEYIMFSGDRFNKSTLMDVKGTVYQIQYAYSKEDVYKMIDQVIYKDMLAKWRELNG